MHFKLSLLLVLEVVSAIQNDHNLSEVCSIQKHTHTTTHTHTHAFLHLAGLHERVVVSHRWQREQCTDLTGVLVDIGEDVIEDTGSDVFEGDDGHAAASTACLPKVVLNQRLEVVTPLAEKHLHPAEPTWKPG